MLAGRCWELLVSSSQRRSTNMELTVALKLFGSRYVTNTSQLKKITRNFGCIHVSWTCHFCDFYSFFLKSVCTIMQTGALLLDGNTLNYFGKNIPINLVLAVVAEVVLLGGAEYYRITNGLVCSILRIKQTFLAL